MKEIRVWGVVTIVLICSAGYAHIPDKVRPYWDINRLYNYEKKRCLERHRDREYCKEVANQVVIMFLMERSKALDEVVVGGYIDD